MIAHQHFFEISPMDITNPLISVDMFPFVELRDGVVRK